MVEQIIRFEDGAAYEQMMGIWSRLVGEVFLHWLAPSPGLRWIDVGCGNGAFTELLIERCAPVDVEGIDPSEGQLAFARTRPSARLAKFSKGDAMALPFASGSFDAAVMALVVVFVPDPRKGSCLGRLGWPVIRISLPRLRVLMLCNPLNRVIFRNKALDYFRFAIGP